MSVSMALAQNQPNSISRDELIKITNLMEKMGLSGYCEWRGLDSDIFLPYNQRFDLDEETSLYEIHCIAGASHAEYMYLALLKGNEEEGLKETLNLLHFPFPVVSGEGEDALIGVKVKKLLTNSGYNEKKKELSSSSSYHAGTVASIAVYKLRHVPGSRSLPEFILKEMIIDSISDKKFDPNIIYNFASDFVFECDEFDDEEAYDFGLSIQESLRNKDTAALFELIDGELMFSGPRRSFALSRPFDEVFSAEWVEEVLSSNPGCTPVGDRGYLLGNGKIWYKKIWYDLASSNDAGKEDKYGNNYTIIAIQGEGVSHEDLPGENDIGWQHNGEYIHPHCFMKSWGIDNQEADFLAFAKHFKLKNFQDFKTDPGKYFGKEIYDFNPIKSPLCTDGEECETHSLISSLKECSKDMLSQTTDDEIIVEFPSTYGSHFAGYRIILSVNKEMCTQLAPNIGFPCEESFFIYVWDDYGGSMGRLESLGIYGLFNLPELEKSIIPLRYFSKTNDGINFILNNPK